MDAIVFGGGIAEDTPFVRKRICEGLAWCGVHLDSRRNQDSINQEICLSPPESKLQVWVVLVDESLAIARQARKCWAIRS